MAFATINYHSRSLKKASSVNVVFLGRVPAAAQASA